MFGYPDIDSATSGDDSVTPGRSCLGGRAPGRCQDAYNQALARGGTLGTAELAEAVVAHLGA